MINWIAGQWPDRFKCLVTHDGIFDNRSMYYSTEELWFPEWEMGGPEYADPAGYAKFNPLDYVSKWKTPTLVVHGQLDYRVPSSKGSPSSQRCSAAACPASSCTSPTRITGCSSPRTAFSGTTVLAWLNRWTAR